MFAVFLISGLFLGWSLGANDPANVFGTAVGTGMISFRKAAIFSGIFVIFGAVISGAGAAETLGKLGAVNAIAGAFVVALAAAVTVYWLTVLGYPVSTTQAIVGSVIGIAVIRGGRGIRWRILGEITGAWVATPIVAVLISFISLFIFQNVFQQKAYIPVEYQITAEAKQRIRAAGIRTDSLTDLQKKTFPTASQFQNALSQRAILNAREMSIVMAAAELDPIALTVQAINRINNASITADQKRAVLGLVGKAFNHRSQLEMALAEKSPEWKPIPGNKEHNDKIMLDLDYVYRLIRSTR
jgi:phosphate/sulfate permease